MLSPRISSKDFYQLLSKMRLLGCLAVWQYWSQCHQLYLNIPRLHCGSLRGIEYAQRPQCLSSWQQALVYMLRYDSLHKKPRAYAPWSVTTFLLSVLATSNIRGRVPAVSILRQLAIDVSRKQCATSHVTRKSLNVLASPKVLASALCTREKCSKSLKA